MRRARRGARGKQGQAGSPGPAGAQGPQGVLPGITATAVTSSSTDASDVLLGSSLVPAQGALVLRVQVVAVRSNGTAAFEGEIKAVFRNETGSLATLDSDVFGSGSAVYVGAWATVPPASRPRIVFAASSTSGAVFRRGLAGVGITWQTTFTVQKVEPAI